MRKIAQVPNPTSTVVRLMLYDASGGTGVYLFGYDSLEDSGSLWDSWFETVADAEEAAFEAYEVKSADWQLISDPRKDCQHDWIASVRVKGRDTGSPQWDRFERLENNEWVDFTPA